MADLGREIREVQGRARLAAGALAVSGLLRVWDVVARGWSLSAIGSFQRGDGATQATLENADTMVNFATYGLNAMLLITAVTFLRWVHGTVRVTRSLSGGLRWTPSEAVWGFIIPFISLVRPFQVLRDVHDILAPDAVPAPMPRVVVGEQDHYRGVHTVDVAPPPALPPAFIGAWWGSFVMVNLANRALLKTQGESLGEVVTTYQLAMAVSALAVVAAALAVIVVRGVTARLAERHRRLEHLDPQDLASYGVSPS